VSSNYTEAQRAAGKIGIAIQRIADKYVFHCRVLEQFKIQERPSVCTLAAMVAGDDILLLYNANFVLDTPMAQLPSLLLHEVHHVVFGHICAKSVDYPDRWARVVAEEVTANEFIKEPLPDDAILLKDFPCLIAMQSTHERYEILKQETVRAKIAIPVSQALGDGPESGKGALDDHSVWEEGEQDGDKAKATVESLIQEVVLEVGPGCVPADLTAPLRCLGIGNTPGGDHYDVRDVQRGHLDWRRLLRRYVGQILQVRATFSRPSRRFPNLVGIVPGKCRRCERPRVMAIIDTSGSVTPKLLELISSELTILARHYTVLVIECDAVVHAVYEYRCPLKDVHGGGGTDFRPPLESTFLRKHRPDLVVYFTDGLGPAPHRTPRVPLVWCLTPGGQRPAGWGRVIQMDGKSKR